MAEDEEKKEGRREKEKRRGGERGRNRERGSRLVSENLEEIIMATSLTPTG